MATDFLFQAGPHGEDDWVVLEFTGTEAMSQPFQFDIVLGGQDLVVDFEEVIGAEACLKFTTPHGERYVHGIIARFEEVGHQRHFVTYEARLVPRMWTLGLYRDSRIWQGQSTPDIVKAVLTEAGVPSDQFRFSLQGSYAPRTFCVQYGETDLDFVHRLLEEEGIFYFFEQTEDGHVMVIADANDACEALEGEDEIKYREGDPGMLGLEQVVALRYARSLKVASVSLRDFDFKKPSLKLEATEKDTEQKRESLLAVQDYPGEYPDQGLGDRLVKTRLEEQRAERYTGVGESDCRRFTPGRRYTLAEHAIDDVNQEYLLLAVRHRGTQPQGGLGGSAKSGRETRVYRNAFESIPAETPYRPLRVTPRPHIDGLQTAMVVGASGEEIHCDEYGRVKVKFPWDRAAAKDDKASCWVRVSQQWGGGGWGSMYIPRVGQEVIVEFLEGDPDRPLVTGRVYNGGSPVPYELPHQKTMATMQSSSSPGGKGGNELRLTDTASAQEFFINATKDMNSEIENNRRMKITANESVRVGGSVTRSVDGEEKVTVVQNRNETVGVDQSLTVKGDESTEVDGALSRTIGSVRLRLIKGDSKLETGSNGRTVGLIAIELIKGESKREVDGNARVNAGAVAIEAVKGDHNEESEDKFSILVGGAVFKKTKGDVERTSEGMVVFTTPNLKIEAPNIEIEGKDKIALGVGGSAVVIESGSVSFESGEVKVKASGDLESKGSMIPWN